MFSLHEKRIILAFGHSPIQESSFLDTVLQPHISNQNHPYWLFQANNILKLDSGSCWQKKHRLLTYITLSLFFFFFLRKGNKTRITLSSPKKKVLRYVHSVNKDMYLKLVWADLFLLGKFPPKKEKLKTRKRTDFGGFQ